MTTESTLNPEVSSWIEQAQGRHSSGCLYYAPEHIRDNKEAVIASVKEYSGELKFASERLKNDKQIVLAAVKSIGGVVQFASERLKKDYDVAMCAVDDDDDEASLNFDFPLIHLPCFKDNKKVVSVAVGAWGDSLQFASERLRNNAEIVRLAISQTGRALEFAHPDLQKNKNIVEEAVTDSGDALEFAHPDLQKDKEIVRVAVEQTGGALEFAHPELKDNMDIVLLAIKNKLKNLVYASPKHRCSEQIMREHWPEISPYISDDFNKLLMANNITISPRTKQALKHIASSMPEANYTYILSDFNRHKPLLLEVNKCIKLYIGQCILDKKFKCNKFINDFEQMIIDHAYIIDQLTLHRERSAERKIVLDTATSRPETRRLDMFQSWLDGQNSSQALLQPTISANKDIHIDRHSHDDQKFQLVLKYKEIEILAVPSDVMTFFNLDSPEDLENILEKLRPNFDSIEKRYFPPKMTATLYFQGIHPREYFFYDKSPIGFKDEFDKISLQFGADWPHIFSSLQKSNTDDDSAYQFSEHLQGALKAALDQLMSPLEPQTGSFLAVLSSLKEPKSVRFKLEKFLVAWLKTYNAKDNLQTNVIKRYLCQEDNPHIKKDPLFKSMINPHLSCAERCKIFMTFMHFARFDKNYCVVKNEVHAWIATDDGQALELGGIPVDIQIIDANQTISHQSNNQVFFVVTSEMNHERKEYERAQGEKKRPTCSDPNKTEGPRGDTSEEILACMNKVLIPSSLPKEPSSGRITGDSFCTAHQALINQYNGGVQTPPP